VLPNGFPFKITIVEQIRLTIILLKTLQVRKEMAWILRPTAK
jgi:hypothetical protein